MPELDNSQIHRIIRWVGNHNLSVQELEDEMIDHISCEVESIMNKGESFDEAFRQAIGLIPEGQLSKIEEASLYLTNITFRIMKQLSVISGLLVLTTFFLAFFSAIFQPQLTDEFLLAGMGILSIAFIPLFFITNYRSQKEGKQKILHILGFTGTLLVAVSAILSYFDVQFSGVLIIAGIILLLLGFFPLFLISYTRSPYLNLARGTLLLFLFISIYGVGYYNLSISKDMVDYWLQKGKEIKASNEILEKISDELADKAALESDPGIIKVHSTAKDLNNSIKGMRIEYIQSLDKNYEDANMVFSGMDYNRTGRRLIKSWNAKLTLEDISGFKKELQNLLSETNERKSGEIDNLLTWEGTDENKIDESLKFLFYGYPAIVNSTIIRSMETSILLSEIKTTNHLIQQSHEEAY